MDTEPYTRTRPEDAAKAARKRALREHRDMTRKMTENYEAILAQLPEDQRVRARRLERRREPKAPLQFVSGLIRDPADFRRMVAYAQALYGIESGWDPGRQWFDDFLSPTIANQMAMRVDLTRLILSIAGDLDHSCRIKRQGKERGGIRRMWEGSVHVPSYEHTGLGWIFSIYEPGCALYFPRYRAALKLTLGQAVCFPREAYPGISPVPEGLGARFTLESHAPPIKHQRSILLAPPQHP